MNTWPDSNDDVIDSRDVIEAIVEIEAELDDMPASGTEPDSDERAMLVDTLATLKALADEADGYSDWEYGATLIHHDHFEEYARQLAEDCAGSKEEADLIRNGGGEHWPFTCMRIDWEAAAEALKQDYATVEFDGVEYWILAY